MSYASPTANATLDPLNWGTSAETTQTLGLDRLNTRVPPTQCHLDHFQLTQCKNLLISITQYLAGGTRLRMVTQSSNTFGVGEYGIQLSTTGVQYSLNGGTLTYLQPTLVQTVSFSATPTFDPSLGSYAQITMTGNITSWTLTTSGLVSGQFFTLVFIQDGTGSRTLAGAPASVKYAGGSLTLTATASKRDAITFRWDGTSAYEVARSLNL